MNALQQVLHIFRKDVRALRWEIAALMVLNGIFVASILRNWERAQPNNIDATVLPLVLLWGFLIARVVHQEPLPGDRQFWRTRPYHPAALFTAKLFFVVAIILLPLALSQWAILTYAGLGVPAGPMLLNLARLAGIQLLPVAVLAALTRNLKQFFLAGFLAVPCLYIAYLTNTINRLSITFPSWKQVLLASASLASISLAVLALQYRRSWTKINAGIFFSASAAMVLFTPIFEGLAEGIRPPVETIEKSPIQLAIGPPPPNPVPTRSFPHHLRIPISISGTPEPGAIIAGAWLSLEAPNAWGGNFGGEVITEAGRQILDIRVDPQMYEALDHAPPLIQKLEYIVRFSQSFEVDLPRDSTPVRVSGFGFCNTTQEQDLDANESAPSFPIFCRTALGFVSLYGIIAHDQLVLELPGRSVSILINPIGISEGSFWNEGKTRLSREARNRASFRFVARQTRAIHKGSVDIAHVHLASYAAPE